MPLAPKKMKYRKSQRGKIKGNATQGNRVVFGNYGLQSLELGWVDSKQIEAARVAATHFLHGEGKVYIRVFPHKTVTATPQETRMGKGKGEIAHYVAVVKPGTIMFEIGGVTKDIAKQALNRIAYKLCVHTRFVEKYEM